jgi:hypothetical protein
MERSKENVSDGGAVPVLVVTLVTLVIVTPRPQPEQAAALVVIGCSLGQEALSENGGALTTAETEELRRPGLYGPLGVVAIITSWTEGSVAGTVQRLPIGEPSDGRPCKGPRTVIVTSRIPAAPLEAEVAFTTSGLYVNGEKGWTAIPQTAAPNKRVRISLIRDAPGNVTVEVEDVNTGSPFRYCH